ncbi:PDR/VanB family oxidoreductase [Roseomonas xinghualingensis]|uniref:PDR/VanB family oxidoreductase n=1 Tax=Roseomonas xinghualingensis TaxID=2986475 RepID=UPI0021F208D9|nr:PDR/VanB family oxidoreductase [Roseomonas sp. SXEYE001]MCV4209100.1 PDR/VanB family oxidoreductase [Roseomonas sp. SXEYE001]
MLDAPAADLELMTLHVARSEPAADGIQLFELRHPDGAELPPFTPGSHLAVRVPTGAMRNYSLCNDPHERDRYVIAVKREERGRGGSVGLINNIAAGATLEVSAPRNMFELDTRAPEYIFVAGGIGITPILAMIRYLRAEGSKPFRLFYLTRAAPGTAFLSELANPAFAGGNSIVIHHDEGDPEKAYDLWPIFENPTRAHIYCCGPRPLMDAVRDMTGHWPDKAVHFEDFGSDLVRPRADDQPFAVKIGPDGEELEVPVGITILEVLRAHGRKLPSSCESGTCGTCRTRYLSGEVDHRDMVLTPTEQKSALMICVSRAKTGTLVLDL